VISSDVVLANPVTIGGNLTITANSSVSVSSSLITFASGPNGVAPLQISGCAQIAGRLVVSLPKVLQSAPILTQGQNCPQTVPLQIDTQKAFVGCEQPTTTAATYQGSTLQAVFSYDNSGCGSSSSTVFLIAGLCAAGAVILIAVAIVLLWWYGYKKRKIRALDCLFVRKIQEFPQNGISRSISRQANV